MKLALLLYAVMICNGAFEYRTGSPDYLFPYQIAIHDCSSPVVMMTPALLPFAGGLLLNSSTGRPYSEETLSTAGSAVQYGSGKYGFQLSWNSFGAEFYREHTFSLKAGCSIFPFLHTGITENIYFLKIASSDISLEMKTADTDFAVILAPYQWINAAFIQTGIVSLINKQNRDLLYPDRSAGILLKPGRGFSIAWNITDTAIEKINTFELTVNPVSFLSVRGGYCRENSSFAASFGFLAENFFVSYGLKYHPYLGYTNSIGITYTLNDSIDNLEYGKPLIPDTPGKINIQTASVDDLKKINGITALSAERIILYRRKVGPVNEKGLMQIGLTGEEIKILESNIYGLERTSRNKDNEKNFKKFKKRPPRKERIKKKFRELVNKGIPALTAIRYSEISETADDNGFDKVLFSDISLNEAQKNIIRNICSE